MKPRFVLLAALAASCLSSTAWTAEPAAGAPQLFVAGDSTAFGYEPNPRNQQGWAAVLQPYFDAGKLRVVNAARGGRSSRTFITEGLWDQLLTQLRKGDYVIIQFGHNDAGPVNEEPPGSKRPPRARGTLPGIGAESREIDNLVTGKHETVYSYGWYVRRMIQDVRAKGATAILLTPTKANSWKRGQIPCAFEKYRQWTYQLATDEKVVFLDLSRITADRYQREGSATVKAQFIDGDNLHTNLAGAKANARDVVSGLRALDTLPLRDMLSNEGRKVPADSGPPGDSVCAALQP
jgi:lysophospholipase L1-like esterase